RPSRTNQRLRHGQPREGLGSICPPAHGRKSEDQAQPARPVHDDRFQNQMKPQTKIPSSRALARRVLSCRTGVWALLAGVILLTSVDAFAQARRKAKAANKAEPAEQGDREPPGAAPDPPSTMDKIAAATDVPYVPK